MADKHPSQISILDFTYELPQEKIATFPLENRDESKLLIFKNDTIEEDVFKNLDAFLDHNSLLVFNTSKVIQARLNFLNSKQQPIEIFCLEPTALNQDLTVAMASQKTANWNCLVGNLKQWKEEFIYISGASVRLTAKIVDKKPNYVGINFCWEPAHLCFAEVLEKIGSMPIPPYLKRESEEVDQSRYQTIYANSNGSVAAPTAGLHFTKSTLEKLEKKMVSTLSLTLHVGAGTFKPVKSARLQGHEMHSEWMDVDIHTIKTLLHSIDKNIIAVGTTSLRTIETLYWMGVKACLNEKISLSDMEIKQWEVYDLDATTVTREQSLAALLNWMGKNGLEKLICHTQILIAPPYQLKLAKGIITNFHQPQSTLLLLISSIVGERWKDIYTYALENNFRFLSYGDSSLLLK